MPGKDNKPWPWDDLQAEWLTTKKEQFPTVKSFFEFKGIPIKTGEKHGVGWGELREAIIQRAADRAVTKLENAATSLIEGQGKKLGAIFDLTFESFLVCEKKGKNKGKPKEPFELRADLSDEIKARLFSGTAMLQQRLLGLRVGATAKILDEALYKTGAMHTPDGTPITNENSKVLAILQNPKAFKLAEQLRDAIGKPVIEVANGE